MKSRGLSMVALVLIPFGIGATLGLWLGADAGRSAAMSVAGPPAPRLPQIEVCAEIPCHVAVGGEPDGLRAYAVEMDGPGTMPVSLPWIRPEQQTPVKLIIFVRPAGAEAEALK